MGQTIGFPPDAVKMNRTARTEARKKLLKQEAPRETAPIEVDIDCDVYLDLPEEWFGLTTPNTKYDYDVYLTTDRFKAAVYPHNREYRYVERTLPDGAVETIYSGPNFLDSRTVIEDAAGNILCTIRANHLGNGVIEVRYLPDGSYTTEHQAPEEYDNFSYEKDNRGRITSLTLADGTHLRFAYGGTSPTPYMYTDKDGVEWRRCPRSEMFKNAEGKSLGDKPVQMVAANESGSYMFASYGRYTVMHRNGVVEERYFPTVRDLLDQNLPVIVAIRSEKDRERAERFAESLRAQYSHSDILVDVLPCEDKDGAIVAGRHVSRFY
ncbi:MAG TPA: hypothetical protein PKZ32_01840 [Candidatus Melainabacteria bacterium]|nr:hypothetical protein [Candidatus Melainabacteria bacterium]